MLRIPIETRGILPATSHPPPGHFYLPGVYKNLVDIDFFPFFPFLTLFMAPSIGQRQCVDVLFL